MSPAELKKLVLAAAEEDLHFKSILQLLVAAVGANAGVVLLMSEAQHSFHIIEELGLTTKQRRGLESWLPSVAELSSNDAAPRSSSKSSGMILVFSDKESQKGGSSSAVIYYLVRGEKILCALAFFRESGAFDKTTLAVLDSVASPITLLAENRFYKEKAKATDELVNLDGLTGLFNHQYFQENLSNELLKSQRFEHHVSVLLIDVDHFKKINDRYGHPQGDVVLQELAQILKKTIRAYDVPARYGGEEFSVVLPHANQGQALQVAQRFRKAVFDHAFPGRTPREQLKITVSVGVASSPTNAKTKAELIARADQALYLAKSEGRNRVCLSLAQSTEPIKIGFCPATLNGGYYRDVLAGMEDVIREIKQVELSVRAPDNEFDYPALEGLFREFVQEKVHAIAVCTQSPTTVQDLKILHRAKIPVFFFNVPEELNDRKISSYIGYEQTEAGKTAALYLARMLRGRGKVAILEGLQEPTNRLRVAGFRKALSSFPQITIVASEQADWSMPLARKVTTELLHRHEDLDAIFAVSDAMALGAVEAVKTKKKLGSIFVVGFDGTKDALDSVKDGGLTATLDTAPREMGRILLRTMVRSLVQQEKVDRQILSPVHIVTAENVDDAIPSERNPEELGRSSVAPHSTAKARR
ncbi:MAG: diguanylate cyclase [Polyangiaceae bacterium]